MAAPPSPPAPAPRTPSPPAAVHPQRPRPASTSAPAAHVPPRALWGPPPTYDEAMALQPEAVREWACANSERPPAYVACPANCSTAAPGPASGPAPAPATAPGPGHGTPNFTDIFDASCPGPAFRLKVEGEEDADDTEESSCVDMRNADWEFVAFNSELAAALAEEESTSAPSARSAVANAPSTRRICARHRGRVPDEGEWPPYPMHTLCPCCQRVVCTHVEVEDAEYTHLCALGLCLMGCWPFCILPYCVDACRRVRHSCPLCSRYLGSYSPQTPPRSRHASRGIRGSAARRRRGSRC